MEKIIGIDASRCRSGGVIAYLIGILTIVDPREYGINQVHFWCDKSLANLIPDYPWIFKHVPTALEKSIIHQLSWQCFKLPQELRKYSCSLLFNPDAGTFCSFTPSISMSQDMLPYEPGEMQRFGFSKARLRLLILKYMQIRSFQRSCGVIFLTSYVKKILESFIGDQKNTKIIPHGINSDFRYIARFEKQNSEHKQSYRCIYVSNAALYKHQWQVIKAIGLIRQKGIDVSLLLVGGGEGRAQLLLERQLAITDPTGEFIQQLDFVNHDTIPNYLLNSDIFIFASSCENMPITLLEAMGAGLPIACSDRGPMPEILEDAGVYFDPEDAKSIAIAVENIITNSVLRQTIATRAKKLSEQYTWEKCAKDTWTFLSNAVLNK